MTDDNFEIFLAIHANHVFKLVQLVLDSILLTQANIDDNNIFAFKFPQLLQKVVHFDIKFFSSLI